MGKIEKFQEGFLGEENVASSGSRKGNLKGKENYH